MSVSGAYDDGFDEPVRESALLCWPAHWIGESNPVPVAHCTLLYWPEPVDKETLLRVLREAPIDNDFYRLADVLGPDAFGENKDYPVLRINSNLIGRTWRHTLDGYYDLLSKWCAAQSVAADDTWEFIPHVSVDIKTIIAPPKQLILGPLELWYKDDEPVVV